MKELEVNWITNGGEFETTLNLSPTVEPWDEFHTNLYVLNFNLEKNIQNDSVQFGLREITHNDKDLLIKTGPVNLRLTHDGGEFPLTGYPAMDVESWKKIIQTCKNYGLNGMRFHSWCPPEAAFEAADELGFYLAPECGLWADFGSPQMKQWLNDETARILKTYGNHPSFILLSPSNEPAKLFALHAAMGGGKLCERSATTLFRWNRLERSVASQWRRAIRHARPFRRRTITKFVRLVRARLS